MSKFVCLYNSCYHHFVLFLNYLIWCDVALEKEKLFCQPWKIPPVWALNTKIKRYRNVFLTIIIYPLCHPLNVTESFNINPDPFLMPNDFFQYTAISLRSMLLALHTNVTLSILCGKYDNWLKYMASTYELHIRFIAFLANL